MGAQRLAGSTPANPPMSPSPDIPISPVRIQWETQRATAGERTSPYVQAQKLWELAQEDSAPENRLFNDMSELSIEIEMRGNSHVIEGLSRWARQAFKNWRSQVHYANQNAGNNGQCASSLFREYEEALPQCELRNHALDVDEDHRLKYKEGMADLRVKFRNVRVSLERHIYPHIISDSRSLCFGK